MKTKIYGILFSAAMFTILSFPASAQNSKDLEIIRETNKVALVIGNSDYQNGFNKLSSPKNDAAAMAAALRRLDFRLIGGKAHIDTSFAEMDDLLDKFTDELKNGGIGFFYFSGHGSQNAKRENYLIPVDTKISFQSDLNYKAMQVEQITSRMEQTGNILNILVLDACRNNPLPSGTKSAGKGLNPNNYVPGGVYIAFAARDGQTALDGDTGGYSLYTRELLKNIETPDERLEDFFIKTRIAVKSKTKNQQFPIDYGSIDGRFYFNFNGKESSDTTADTVVPANRVEEATKFYNAALDCNSADYDCQISNYSKSINLDPNYANAYDNRGTVYFDKQNYDRAIEDFNKAIQINSNADNAYNNRGSAYFRKHNYDRSIEDFDKAIQLNPNFADAYNNRAASYYSKENYDHAIEDYNKAIQIAPKKADTFLSNAYFKRGLIYYQTQNYDLAIEDYSKAIQLDSKFTNAYYNRGSTYFQKRNYDRAIVDYNKAIQLKPDDASVYSNLGSAYFQKQNYDGAIENYNKAIQLNPNDPLYYRNRAAYYDQINDKSKADEDRRMAKSLEKP